MRVLLATDGSACAEVAVELVAATAWPTPSTIDVVEAVGVGVAVFGGPWPPLQPIDTTPFDDDIRGQAKKHLAAAAERLAAPGRSVETSSASGRAADVIISLATQTGADLIVVGSRGHGTLQSMLLGSVSAEVVDRARIPVLVARGSTMRQVVFAWDGSDCAERAARVMTEWGILGESDIRVLSVADAEAPWWADMAEVGEEAAASAYERAAGPSREQHDQLARDMAGRLLEAGLKATPERRDGDPAGQIVKAAEALQADLVVVGTHGRTGLNRLLMGSVARNVLHHSHCSVLIVHAQADDPAAAES